MQDNIEVTRAGFGPRAAAYIIDRAVILAGVCVLRLPFLIASLMGAGRLTAKAFLFRYSFADVLCWLAGAAYLVLLTYYTGSTLGKKVMRLRVETEEGEPPRFIDILYRETVGRFLSGVFCVGYLMALADKKKRAFHDWLCDTRVVYAETGFRRKEGGAPEETPPAPDYGYTLPGEEPPAEALPGTAEDAPEAACGYSIPGGDPAPAEGDDTPFPPVPEEED